MQTMGPSYQARMKRKDDGSTKKRSTSGQMGRKKSAAKPKTEPKPATPAAPAPPPLLQRPPAATPAAASTATSGTKLTPFQQAFRDARKRGDTTFPFNGKTYTTQTKEEKAKAARKEPTTQAGREENMRLAELRGAGSYIPPLSVGSNLYGAPAKSAPQSAPTPKSEPKKKTPKYLEDRRKGRK